MAVNLGLSEQVNNESINPENGLNAEVSNGATVGYVPTPRPVVNVTPVERPAVGTTEKTDVVPPKTTVKVSIENVHKALTWAIIQANAQAHTSEGF